MRIAPPALCLATLFAAAQTSPQRNTPATPAAGQSAPATSAHPPQKTSKPQPKEEASPVPAQPSTPAPSPAQVTLANGLLTIKADDSDLNQILSAVVSAAGTKVDGQVSDQRVYGVYGPGVPSTVLSNLLADTGVNVLMAGVNEQGAPDKLVLLPRAGGVTPPATSAAAEQPAQTYQPVIPSVQQDEAGGAQQDGTSAQETGSPAQQNGEQLGPGAIANVPPEPPEDQQTRMQLNLQRLQQMHDQQSQPQAPQ